MGDKLFAGFETGAFDDELLGFGGESELSAMTVDDGGDEGVRLGVVVVLGETGLRAFREVAGVAGRGFLDWGQVDGG